MLVRDVVAKREIAEPPVAAVSRDKKRKLVAVGHDANSATSQQPVDVVNPFTHPRSLLSDFAVAEQVLKRFLTKLFAGRLFVPSPVVVMHPKLSPEGGLTQVEIRVLRELAIGAGARRVIVWEGRDLRDEEVAELKFEGGGRVLD